jgi:hypothetical protein
LSKLFSRSFFIALLFIEHHLVASPGEISFTPTSFKVPVREVSITGANAYTVILSCDSVVDEDCMIDMADWTTWYRTIYWGNNR